MFSRSRLSHDACISRRQALSAGALGSVGLSLPQLLRAETATGRRARSVIWIVPWGGPATLDTFDLKPHAPAEIRSTFRPIATRTPGFHISEHLPRLAAMSDKYAIIRSMSHRISVHNAATSYTLTGTPPAILNRELTTANRGDFPTVGSILAKFQPSRPGMPSYVQLPLPLIDNGAFTGGQTAGFLGTAFDPLVVAKDPNLADFEVPSAPATCRHEGPALGQRDILAQLDAHAEAWSQSAAAANMETHYERAYELLRSAATARAFDVAMEPAAVRDRYGRNTLGQSVLVARRLIEAGVRLVMVSDTMPNTNNAGTRTTPTRTRPSTSRLLSKRPIARSRRCSSISTSAATSTTRWCSGPANSAGRRAATGEAATTGRTSTVC